MYDGREQQEHRPDDEQRQDERDEVVRDHPDDPPQRSELVPGNELPYARDEQRAQRRNNRTRRYSARCIGLLAVSHYISSEGPSTRVDYVDTQQTVLTVGGATVSATVQRESVPEEGHDV